MSPWLAETQVASVPKSTTWHQYLYKTKIICILRPWNRFVLRGMLFKKNNGTTKECKILFEFNCYDKMVIPSDCLGNSSSYSDNHHLDCKWSRKNGEQLQVSIKLICSKDIIHHPGTFRSTWKNNKLRSWKLKINNSSDTTAHSKKGSTIWMAL